MVRVSPPKAMNFSDEEKAIRSERMKELKNTL